MRRSSRNSRSSRHSVVQDNSLILWFNSKVFHRGPPSARLHKNCMNSRPTQCCWNNLRFSWARGSRHDFFAKLKRINVFCRLRACPAQFHLHCSPCPLQTLQTWQNLLRIPAFGTGCKAVEIWGETPSEADFWRSKGHVTRIIALHCWNKLLRFIFCNGNRPGMVLVSCLILFGKVFKKESHSIL